MLVDLKRGVHRLLRLGDLDVHRHSASTPSRRARLLDSMAITLVVDVGANVGQYGRELRQEGHLGRIYSFEPLPDAFAALESVTARDPSWSCERTALGDFDGEAEVHVAANSASSSLLDRTELLSDVAPETEYIDQVNARVSRLDTVAPILLSSSDAVYLKLDVQGFEARVLAGAVATLPRVQAVEVELSTEELYAGQAGYLEVMRLLSDAGFGLGWLERGLSDPRSGRLLQFDAIFLRP